MASWRSNPLESSALPNPYPEERRLATILFADVQGFTAPAEQLDSETVGDLIKDIWSRLEVVIEDGGGYIDKHMGDNVMAIWGAPWAGERDAQKSVEVALKMQDALAGCLAASTVDGVGSLRLRIGINTGQVFATYIGIKREYTVIGELIARVNPGMGTPAILPESVMQRLIQDGLRQLVRAELVFPRSGTRFSREQEFIFGRSPTANAALAYTPGRGALDGPTRRRHVQAHDGRAL